MAMAGVVLAALLAAGGCAPSGSTVTPHEKALFASRSLADPAVLRVAGSLDPATRALAERHDPALRHADLWGRPEGWSNLDLRRPPDLGLQAAPGETAQELNALLPFAHEAIRPMRPFVLPAAAGEDRERALTCLAQAVYYEAAREPEVGQEAIAQVVLNRVRHPAYPKSVCGVVYQGAARPTGCQFTFTCDGALRWAPEPTLWRRARQVAERALAGYVDKQVGSATHYHADYVAPYWAPTLVKMTQVGQHIFYRWTGPWGEPPAFTGRYEGGEAHLSPAVLGGVDARIQGGLMEPQVATGPVERKVTLAMAGETRTFTVVDPGVTMGRSGVLTSSRRQPTPEEIKRINQSLEALERGTDDKPAPATPAAPAASD
ncbi:MAG: cell wall hydrolase [Caulobacterales bacterium]|nr:cell wall hydrolase [Caulobacterales bacterium]